MVGAEHGLGSSQARADDLLSAAEAMLGQVKPVSQWNEVATRDNIEHWAMGIGDDNPLWWDAAYAVASPLGGVTAPPTYLYSHANGPSLGTGDRYESPLAALPGLVVGERWVWRRSVRLDETIQAYRRLQELKTAAPEAFALEVEHTEFRTPGGEIVAENVSTIARFGQDQKIAGGRYAARVAPKYSEADRQDVEARYRKEAAARRGAVPRYFEDCEVGERLPEQLKGPLSLNNLIGYLLGQGSPYNATNRMAYTLMAREPQLRVVLPDSGAADTPESAHWEPALARCNGLPAGYDYGAQRCSWMAHAVCDWMGDHGVLSDLDVRLLAPNFISDLTSVHGEVTGKEDAGGVVEVRLEARNQSGEATAEALARVRLPRRGGR
jgi:acyl dehydratase